MADINTAVARSFANGGTIQIGADTVVNIAPSGGGFRFTAAVPKRMLDAGMNQGVLQAVPEGAQQRGTLSFAVRFTGDSVTVGGVYELFTRASTDGLVVTHDIVITVFDYLGATAGDRFTFAGAFLSDNGLGYASSDGQNDGDMLELDLLHSSMKPIASAVT